MEILRGFIDTHKPGWIVIDTTTYASMYNTGKPNEAKLAYDPIMDVLMMTGCPGLGLTHTNKEGGVLNRRFLERCRVKIEITRPDASCKERLRIEVTKSDDKYPPPIGAVFTDTGVTYDKQPPEVPEAPRRGRKPSTSPGLAVFLWEYLQAGPAFVADIVNAARDKGLLKAPTTQEPKPSISPLYDARRLGGPKLSGEDAPRVRDDERQGSDAEGVEDRGLPGPTGERGSGRGRRFGLDQMALVPFISESPKPARKTLEDKALRVSSVQRRIPKSEVPKLTHGFGFRHRGESSETRNYLLLLLLRNFRESSRVRAQNRPRYKSDQTVMHAQEAIEGGSRVESHAAPSPGSAENRSGTVHAISCRDHHERTQPDEGKPLMSTIADRKPGLSGSIPRNSAGSSVLTHGRQNPQLATTKQVETIIQRRS